MWLIAIGRAVNTMGFSIVLSFMAIYIIDRKGGSGALYGLIYLIQGLFAATSHAIAGELADRFGRKRVMLSALFLRAANFVALGMVVLLDAPLAVLGVLIVVNGILRAQFEPAAAAAVTDCCRPDQRVAAFALQRMGVNLGWALGPMLGGYLIEISFGGMFFVAALATLLTAMLLTRLHDSHRPPPPAPSPSPSPSISEPEPWTLLGIWRILHGNRAFVAYLVLVLLGAMMTVQLFSTLSVYGHQVLGMSTASIGVLYTVNGLAVILLQIPAVSVIDRAGPRRALIVGPILYTVAYAAIGYSVSFWELAAAVVVLTAGEVVFAPALSDMAAHLGDPRRVGRAFGLFGLMQQIGASIGPLVGGLAFDHLRHDPPVMWGTLAAGMAVVGVGYIVFAFWWKPSVPPGGARAI